MKKRFVFAVCLLLITAMIPVSVMAAGSVDASLSADKTTVNTGDTVTITVSATVDSCGQGGIEITFDDAVFQLTGGKCTLSNKEIDYFDPSTKDGAFAFAGTNTVSGSVFEFQLQIKDTAKAGSHAVSVKFTADSTSVTKSIDITVACTHKYDNACDTSCNLCGATRKITHNWDEGKISTAATCKQEGVKIYTCKECGQTKPETIGKTKHDYKSEVTKAATCSAEGVKTFICTICGDSYTEAIEKLAHSYESKVTTEPTCKAEGVKTVTCSVCGHYYTDSIKKLDHSYKSEVTTEPTCSAEGVKTVTCSACGTYYTDSIAKLSHEYDHDCDPDCNLCGETRETEHIYNEYWSSDETGHWHECGICGDVLEMVPHTPGPEPTEEEDQICLDCGYVLQIAGSHTHAESGDWLGDEENHWHQCACGEILGLEAHTWELGIENNEDGVRIYFCTVCGLPKVEEFTPTEPSTEPTTQPTVPAETQPSADPTVPSQGEPGDQNEPFPWWIVLLLIVGILLIAAVIFVIIGILKSKKQTGKYSS